jgi:hypothetical protein
MRMSYSAWEKASALGEGTTTMENITNMITDPMEYDNVLFRMEGNMCSRKE